jgi:hypothetical protein
VDIYVGRYVIVFKTVNFLHFLLATWPLRKLGPRGELSLLSLMANSGTVNSQGNNFTLRGELFWQDFTINVSPSKMSKSLESFFLPSKLSSVSALLCYARLPDFS